ncbi:hypothetical protein RUM43_006356 [Polyplax serrata]|uniref:Uncharacterized protein n=1 Tax=Polyplax serrata TaxID=468196 RepID=A0AAN8S5E2_POLSC
MFGYLLDRRGYLYEDYEYWNAVVVFTSPLDSYGKCQISDLFFILSRFSSLEDQCCTLKCRWAGNFRELCKVKFKSV